MRCVYPFSQPPGRWWFLTYFTYRADSPQISFHLKGPSVHPNTFLVVELSWDFGSGFLKDAFFLMDILLDFFLFERKFSWIFFSANPSTLISFGGEMNRKQKKFLQDLFPRLTYFPEKFPNVFWSHLELPFIEGAPRFF